MRKLLAVALALCVVSVAEAQENGFAQQDEQAAVTQASQAPVAEVVSQSRSPETVVTEVKVVQSEQREMRNDAVAAQPARGSFWWLVGVIVIAGILLFVVLD